MDLLQYLRVPEIQVLFMAIPMIFVLDSPAMHRVMSNQFKKAAIRVFPMILGVVIVVSIVHPLGIGMGIAILTPYIQWVALRCLYFRFCRKRGRPPKVAVERAAYDGEASDEVGFRMSANIAIVGLPIVIVAVFFSGSRPKG